MQQHHKLETQQGLQSLLQQLQHPWEECPTGTTARLPAGPSRRISSPAAASPMCCPSSNRNIKYTQSVNSLTIFVSNNIYFGKTRIAKK